MVALTHWACFPLRELLMFWPLSQCSVSKTSSSGLFTCLLETGQCHPKSEWSTVLLCCQLPTDFLTSVLSNVFQRLVSVRPGRFMERSGVLPTTQFAYWKGLCTCDALLCVSHTLQSVLESGQQARIVQIYFSAAFDRVCLR